jgi:hypothetical protein
VMFPRWLFFNSRLNFMQMFHVCDLLIKAGRRIIKYTRRLSIRLLGLSVETWPDISIRSLYLGCVNKVGLYFLEVSPSLLSSNVPIFSTTTKCSRGLFASATDTKALLSEFMVVKQHWVETMQSPLPITNQSRTASMHGPFVSSGIIVPDIARSARH